MNIGSLRPRWRPGPTFWVLAISGILGFRIGLIGFPTWHISVETAQVVAGLVRYPPDNPFYIYHTKLWSLVIQLCAALLRAGVSEITLSLALSGLLGMISFQGLALVTYAIGRDALNTTRTEVPCGRRQQFDRIEQIVRHQGHHHIQLEVSRRA